MYRNFFPLLFLALLLISFNACKKGKASFTLQGFVYDETLQSAMENQTVSLYQVIAGTNTEKLVASTKTDALGIYTFTFNRDKAEKYILRVAPTNYFPVEEFLNFEELSIEEVNYKNLSTTAKAWVKLVFTNGDPSNSWDNLRFTLDEGKTGCDECLEEGAHNLIGAVDTVIYTVNDGNTLYRYYYELLSTPLAGYNSATTNAFDTTTLILEY